MLKIMDWVRNKVGTKKSQPRWRDLNRNDKDILIETLEDRVEELEGILSKLIEDFGEIATYCDKCNGIAHGCFKCKETGIVQRKQLFSWPW